MIRNRSFRIAVLFSALVFLILLLTMGLTGLITVLVSESNFIDAPPKELTLLLFAVISIIVGTILSHTVGKRPLNVIREIDDATKEVVKGNFTVRLNEDIVAEELHSMAHNFNTMVRELSNTEILRKDFIENVSHEFQTPLSAIEGYAALLQNQSLTTQKRQEYAERILVNARRLSDLSGNILLLSRLEHQELEIQKETYALDEQIREAILLFETKWTQKELCLEVDLSAIRYKGNKELLMQVWQNLIGNAVKFVSQKGEIRITLRIEKNDVIVTVADNGIGMSEAVQKRIYEKFYQADTSRTGIGNGLGLALAKRIVDLHDGTLTVASAEGKGTMFTVTLPLV
ncbi:HAMP domain-containing sensor histidine kinase [Massilicoli timonensis]|uniref:HAMP domain-containing sensor histidine kinase n=1 Tax=Massilicoli timonensis TaxID=2015901 RepID=UPI000C8665AB|nr:HAMP domain-containing sensor histidine kinase [Massilicoli timonensis]